MSSDQDTPFYTPKIGKLWEQIRPLAREMRHESTCAEDVLWQQLRNRRIEDTKFRRQHAVGRFIVDFFCAEAHLVIEVDGAIHEREPNHDCVRQDYLESVGLRVIRFTNDQILTDIDSVVKPVSAVLHEQK